MGQATSTEAQSGGGAQSGTFNGEVQSGPFTITSGRVLMDQKNTLPIITSSPMSVNIKNSTGGTLYMNTTPIHKLTLASGKTGVLSGLCNSCNISVYKDSQRTQPLIILPYMTFMKESQDKSQPVLDIGFSSKVIDGGTFIESKSMNNVSSPSITFSAPTSTPTAYTPRPTINATPIAPTTMRR